MQTVKKLSKQRSDKGSRIYRSETKGFDFRKAKDMRRFFDIVPNQCVKIIPTENGILVTSARGEEKA